VIEIKPLIIAFDAKRLFNNNTGLGNYSRTLVRNLQKYYPQHKYHLFTPKIIINDETQYFLDTSKFIIHTPKRSPFLYRSWLMSREINNLQPDIFHGLSHEIPFGLHKNIKSVVTFHDLIYEKFPSQFGLWDRYAYKIKYKSSAFRSDYILAISQSTKNDLKDIYHLDDRKIHVVYQSCHSDFQLLELPKNTLLPKKIIGLKDYFLYVGSIIERKGLLDIVKAYSELPTNFQRPFVVVGSGKGHYMQSVHNLIEQYHLKDKFIFLNSISNHQLVIIYDNCFIFIYPSIYEGFGIPIIESLYRKKPVITTTESSLPEAAGPGALLVKPNNVKGIVESIITLTTQKDTYYSKGQRGHEYVKEKFSDDITAKSLMQFYKYILENH